MRAALIGLGMVSSTYADAVAQSADVTLAKVYARRTNSRHAFLDKFAGLGAVAATSITEIANDPAIDFVILTTPPNARADIVAELANAGKPILMEKPVERTLAAATAIVETCEAANLPLGIMLQHRTRPIVADLRAQLADLGRLIAVDVTVPWWRPQSYYDEPGRGTYARDGGGVLISQAIHTMDLMLTLAGPVAAVTATCATTALHKMEAEDFASAGLHFHNGAVGHFFATTAHYPGAGETITLHCRDGSARLAAGVLQINRHDGTSDTIGQLASSGGGADPMAFTSDWHRFVIEDFADAIRDKRAPMITGRSALPVHQLIEAITLADKTGTRQYVKAL